MRIAIVSDFHLGDPMATLAARDEKTGQIRLGSMYKEFKAKINEKSGGQTLDYLVLMGDILDFSIVSYNEAYAIGQYFFQQLKDDNITHEILYIPGNHDFDLWHTVEYQANVTRKLQQGKIPVPFRMSVPGIIDERTKGNSIKGLTLHNVTPRSEENQPKYAGLFLDKITKPDTYFNFVYPNLYLVTDEHTILITHGHFLELYWPFLGRWVLKIASSDLKLKVPGRLNLKEMVGINFPFNQLASSGLGQSGPLTPIVHDMFQDIKNKNLDQLKTYFEQLWYELKKIVKGIPSLMLKFPPVKKWIKNEIFNSISKIGSSRYDKKFLDHPEVRERFLEFYNATIAEITEINRVYNIEIPVPTRMIFGHTHESISWETPEAPSIELAQLPKEKQPLKMYNTGGWLNAKDKNGNIIFGGAEIFYYESNKGITSVKVVCAPIAVEKQVS